MTDRKCENPKCGKELTPERRRFCSSRCQSRAGQRRFRLKRVGAGLCYRCGAALDPRSKSLCTNCLVGNRKYQGDWRADLPNEKLAAIREKNRLTARVRRAADPEGYKLKRRKYYAGKREVLLKKRRKHEGQIPRKKYLESVSKSTRPAKTGHVGRPELLSDKLKKWYKIGEEVEALIPLDKKDDWNSIIQARKIVAERHPELEAGVVAEYHRKYRLAVA
jgi:hypothetical protein